MTTKKTYERDARLDEDCLRPFELVDYNSGDIIQLRCRSRLNDVCPSCAVRYQIVQRRILDEGQPEFPDAANLATGQAQLPSAAFVTLTLQSFGRLTIGHAPKYPKHYRYGAAVTAGLVEPDLLRAFKEALKRACADWIKAGFALAFRGSREVQERGAGPYHLLVTLDPNTAEWDGKTRAPSPVELAERIASVGAGTAAVPAELRTHARSQTVTDRRDQMKLPTASSSTLRIPERAALLDIFHETVYLARYHEKFVWKPCPETVNLL